MLGRFCNTLVELDLWNSYWKRLTANEPLKNVIITQARINIIDATPIEASKSGFGNGKDGRPKKDPEAGWHVKNDSRGRRKSTYG